MVDELLILMFIFLISINGSWLLVYFMPARKKEQPHVSFPSISIILPAHNEEKLIQDSIRNVLGADYPKCKEIIVINDGSTDKTGEKAKELISFDNKLKVIDIPHSGKAHAINTGVKHASGEVIIVLDADSKLGKDALTKLVTPFSDEKIGAVSGIIRADINNNPLTWFQDLEYMMSSTWRHICNKVNGTYLLPGFTAFRKTALEKIGGFQRDTLCEDFEIGLRMKKAGYKMVMSDAIMHTGVPQNLRALARQRFRWSRGTIQVVKKHSDIPLNPRYGSVGFYGIPTQMYWFIHGLIALPLTFYQITYGYLTYFTAHQEYVSMNVANYFISWFSLYGMADYAYKTFTGTYPMTLVFIFCLVSFILGTTYTLLSVLRHSKPDIRHFLAIFFFAPYSLFTLIIFMSPLAYEANPFSSGDANRNIWTK